MTIIPLTIGLSVTGKKPVSVNRLPVPKNKRFNIPNHHHSLCVYELHVCMLIFFNLLYDDVVIIVHNCANCVTDEFLSSVDISSCSLLFHVEGHI